MSSSVSASPSLYDPNEVACKLHYEPEWDETLRARFDTALAQIRIDLAEKQQNQNLELLALLRAKGFTDPRAIQSILQIKSQRDELEFFNETRRFLDLKVMSDDELLTAEGEIRTRVLARTDAEDKQVTRHARLQVRKQRDAILKELHSRPMPDSMEVPKKIHLDDPRLKPVEREIVFQAMSHAQRKHEMDHQAEKIRASKSEAAFEWAKKKLPHRSAEYIEKQMKIINDRLENLQMAWKIETVGAGYKNVEEWYALGRVTQIQQISKVILAWSDYFWKQARHAYLLGCPIINFKDGTPLEIQGTPNTRCVMEVTVPPDTEYLYERVWNPAVEFFTLDSARVKLARVKHEYLRFYAKEHEEVQIASWPPPPSSDPVVVQAYLVYLLETYDPETECVVTVLKHNDVCTSEAMTDPKPQSMLIRLPKEPPKGLAEYLCVEWCGQCQLVLMKNFTNPKCPECPALSVEEGVAALSLEPLTKQNRPILFCGNDCLKKHQRHKHPSEEVKKREREKQRVKRQRKQQKRVEIEKHDQEEYGTLHDTLQLRRKMFA